MIFDGHCEIKCLMSLLLLQFVPFSKMSGKYSKEHCLRTQSVMKLSLKALKLSHASDRRKMETWVERRLRYEQR